MQRRIKNINHFYRSVSPLQLSTIRTTTTTTHTSTNTATLPHSIASHPMDRQLVIAKELTKSLPYLQGIDAEGNTYKDIYTLWKRKLDEKYTAYIKTTSASSNVVPKSKASPSPPSNARTTDTDNNQETTINEQRIALWYKAGRDYWASTTTDVNGVLGGQAHVHSMDINASLRFLNRVMKKYNISSNRCLDCGAGIGRITRDLLINRFDICDLLEQDIAMLKVAIENISHDIQVSNSSTAPNSKQRNKKGQLGFVHVAGLQEYSVLASPSSSSTTLIPLAPSLSPHQTTSLLTTPITTDHTNNPNGTANLTKKRSSHSSASSMDLSVIKYDIIWIQWVVGCIIDSDFVNFLQTLSSQLSSNGYVIIKDNCCRPGLGFWYDTEDDSIQRSKEYLECLFTLGGFTIMECTVTGTEDPTVNSTPSSTTSENSKRPRRSSNTNTKDKSVTTVTKKKEEEDNNDEQEPDEWDPELMSVRTWLLCPTDRSGVVQSSSKK